MSDERYTQRERDAAKALFKSYMSGRSDISLAPDSSEQVKVAIEYQGNTNAYLVGHFSEYIDKDNLSREKGIQANRIPEPF